MVAAAMTMKKKVVLAGAVKKDTSSAFKWYLRSAQRGSYSGQNNVGVCYKFGTGVKKT